MDEVSYVSALIWHMQRPRTHIDTSRAEYSSRVAQAFLHVAPAFEDAWTARIWFEFGRIDLATELTPIAACQNGMSGCIDDALGRLRNAPLPLPADPHDGEALGVWLGCGGARPDA